LKREIGGTSPPPCFHEMSAELILRKCNPERQKHVRAIFEKQPFGELERLVTQTLLDVVKARGERRTREWTTGSVWWLGSVAAAMRRCGSSCLEFLDTDIFHVSAENGRSRFLDPVD